MKYLLLIINFLISISIYSEKFIVAGAANLQYALKALQLEYNQEYSKNIQIVLASSGKIFTQIQNGAPYSIFLSADMNYPSKLYKSGHSIAEPTIYAKGTIVLWSSNRMIDKDIKKILLNPKNKTIAIANPETAPYGKESINILENLKIYNDIKSKLVFAESISQVNQYIFSGAAEIGFTAKSIVTTKNNINKENCVEIDKGLYKPIDQGIIILKYGLDHFPEESKSFYNFIFSKKGKYILSEYGYIINEL